MKALPAALQSHLDDGTTTLAWCWKITRADGVVLGFTDHDRLLSIRRDRLRAGKRRFRRRKSVPDRIWRWIRRTPKAR